MIEYSEDKKHAYFNGLKFTRDDKTGYYLNSTHRIMLHRYVWQVLKGDIPEGHHIHHIDHDKGHNEIENYAAIPSLKHMQLTGAEQTEECRLKMRKTLLEKAGPKAAEWHGSEKGREWHKKHYEKYKARLHSKKHIICDNCGKQYESEKGRFCSNKCKAAWRRKAGLDDINIKCLYCGKDFIVNKYSKATTCSQSCSNRFYNERYKNKKD